MGASDLNVSLDYFDHPKTKRLICLLGKGADVLPLRLWAYVGKYHCADGRLAGYTAEEIESNINWWGKPGAMIEAMTRSNCLWLERIEDGFQVHDWHEHQGHIQAFKRKGRDMANARWNAGSNASSITHSNARSNAPNYAQPNQPSNQPSVPSNIGFDAVRLANRIIGNETEWHYDNCKVDINALKTRPLASVIEPFLAKGATEGKVIDSWTAAVFKAHGASVDGLAKDATAYCVACFKEAMGK